MIERLNTWVGHPLRLFIIVALGVLFTISFLDPHPTVGVPALTSIGSVFHSFTSSILPAPTVILGGVPCGWFGFSPVLLWPR